MDRHGPRNMLLTFYFFVPSARGVERRTLFPVATPLQKNGKTMTPEAIVDLLNNNKVLSESSIECIDYILTGYSVSPQGPQRLGAEGFSGANISGSEIFSFPKFYLADMSSFSSQCHH